jgi:hypothetical protein
VSAWWWCRAIIPTKSMQLSTFSILSWVIAMPTGERRDTLQLYGWKTLSTPWRFALWLSALLWSDL